MWCSKVESNIMEMKYLLSLPCHPFTLWEKLHLNQYFKPFN